MIDGLCKATYFTTLDMKTGFHQVRITEESKHFTSFITPDGYYKYQSMTFGFVNTPACYQRAIDRALGSLEGNIVFVFLDDVLVVSSSIEEGFQNLKQNTVPMTWRLWPLWRDSTCSCLPIRYSVYYYY